jgi:hypothetical protein
MNEEIIKYCQKGITINLKGKGYEVFTIPTQHFQINSLQELTLNRFEKAIQDLKAREEFESKF